MSLCSGVSTGQNLINAAHQKAVPRCGCPRMTEEELSNEQRWPGVGVAFTLIQPSYAQVVQRIDAQEARIRAIMTFATTGTFAVLAFLTGPLNRRDFVSWWFFVGVAVYVVLMVLGVASAAFTETRLLDPNKVYDTMLGLSEWEFKQVAIALAGDDFSANRNTAARLGLVFLAMAILMALEMACLIGWSVQASTVPLP